MARKQQELVRAHELSRGGRLNEAEQIYRSVLRAHPRSFEAAHGLGVVCVQRGAVTEAVQHFGLAAEIEPDSAAAHHDHGLALLALRRSEEALACCDRAIALAPQSAAGHRTRGRALYDLRRDEEAAASFARALEREPDSADAHYRLGNTLLRLGQIPEALTEFERATSLSPSMAAAFNNCGNALRELDRLPEALASYARAVALEPNNAVFCYNHGLALQDSGRLNEALAGYNRAIALRTDFGEARRARGSLKFLQGRFLEGHGDFEWRRQSGDPGLDARIRSIRYWTGEELAGRSILIYGDGAFGDLIQFSRYLPLIAAMGARVTLLVAPEHRKVLSGDALKARVIDDIAEAGADFRCDLLSLPHVFRTEIASVPPVVDPIAPDADGVGRWSAVLERGCFNIGICWQGNPRRDIDRGRSIPLTAFRPLAGLPGVRLVSLQARHGLDQLARLPADIVVQQLADFDAGADAFVDAAAVMRSLDLVVTSDTAIAHLAASLGRPTWIALRDVPEWRWLLERADSPWYPTVRLFRQQTPGDWTSVFDKIAAALQKVLGDARG
jgi:tetratricopeptide (TPR) repeat protein